MAAPKKPVILILGAGANTGLAIASHFRIKEWAVAAAARNPTAKLRESVDLAVHADFQDPSSLGAVFKQTSEALGVPAVVVYNAHSLSPSRASHPLTINAEALANDMAVNTLSPYEAARLAVEQWSASSTSLSIGGAKSPSYFFTGNMMNTQLFPATHSLGMGKNATAYFIETAAITYKGKYRFYYLDERTAEGESVMGNIDGQAHAEEIWDLVMGKAENDIKDEQSQGEWDWTFVKGKGFIKVNCAINREFRGFALPGYE